MSLQSIKIEASVTLLARVSKSLGEKDVARRLFPALTDGKTAKMKKSVGPGFGVGIITVIGAGSIPKDAAMHDS